MDVVTARITSKGQVTVPKKIRDALEIEEGDTVSYEVHDNTAVMKRIPKVDVEWARAIEKTLTEWEDDLDDEL
jgi:AbrB family looped-hinge helix DNA binding protein